MNELIFSADNTIGQLFTMYNYMPYIICTISIDGKQYTGTVNNITIKDKWNTILHGEFHPHLETNYFDAFLIYTDKFEIENIIDLKASPDSTTIATLFHGKRLMDAATKCDMGTIRRNVPLLLNGILAALKDFKLTHPELDLERSINLISECIESTQYATMLLPKTKEDLDLAMTYINKQVTSAMSSLIVS